MFKTSAIVLSPGRTGSVLLAQNLSKSFGVPGQVKYFYEHDLDLSSLNQGRIVGHSHNLFEPKHLSDVLPVYSVRRNLTETLLSNYLASVHHCYHLESKDPDPDFAPVEVNSYWMETIIEQHRAWFDHYKKLLDHDSLVVIYEMMVDYLYHPSQGYKPLYPNKSTRILDYDSVLDWLNRRIPDTLVQDHMTFIDYSIRPAGELYQWAAGLR